MLVLQLFGAVSPGVGARMKDEEGSGWQGGGAHPGQVQPGSPLC